MNALSRCRTWRDIDIGTKPTVSNQKRITQQGNQPQIGNSFDLSISTVSNPKRVIRQGNQPQTANSFSFSASTVSKETTASIKTPIPHSCKIRSSHKSTAHVYEINIDTTKRSLPHIVLKTPVSNTPLSFLIDSGAAICLLKQSSVGKCPNLTKEPVNLKGIDPGDQLTPTLGHFKLNINLSNNKIISHKFHIIQDISLPYDGIIGSDFLMTFGCKIDYTTDTLKIDSLTIKLNFIDPFYVIPPRTETVIESTVQNPDIKEGLVLDQHISDKVFIANCLTSVKRNQRINITIVNTSEKTITINSDLKLKLEPIDISLCAYCPAEIQSNTAYRTKEVLDLLRVDHLNEEERSALFDVCAEYSDIFFLPNDNLSFTNAIEHHIRTTPSAPIHTKSYRFPECHKSEVESQINKMLNQGIIQPSISPWSSPIWIVPKKTDVLGQRKWRVVIDYRKLNDITIGEVYPIPQISEILDQLGKCRYFTTLDLASGFHQVRLSPEDAEKTAFSVPQGHFQFNRMPFGLKNAPSTFQKLMNTCLSGLQGIRCFVYLDDVVIMAADLNGHINNLISVFQRLRSFNLKLQPDKCEFLRKEVGYLGHIISDEGVKPNSEKLRAVTDFPTPKSPKDVKSFLGLVSYYRRFIHNFSKLAKPLTFLLKKDTPFNWQNEQQLAFESLKQRLVTAPVLAYPDFTQPFILTCDASNYAISAILSQGPIGQDRPIAFASRTLNKAECNYSVTEKECLAIIFGTKVFRPYVYGYRFKIITDHKPLQWLFNCKDPGSRLVRWRLKLEEFDYEIQYKKGKINANADALSRFPVNPVQPIGIPTNPDLSQNQPHDNVSPRESVQPVNTPYDDDRDLLDLLISPTSFNLDEIEPFDPSNIDPNSDSQTNQPETTFLPPSSDNISPEIPFDPSHENPNTPRNEDEYSPNDLPVDPPINLSPNPESPSDDYSTFLKSVLDKNKSFNTKITEHNGSLLKSTSNIILIPTSIDLDESNPYIHEILSNLENSDSVINCEKELHSSYRIQYNKKIIYLLFTKVHHLDEAAYPEIFKTLKNVKNEIIVSENSDEIAISDFKNPFEKHSFIKLYNMLMFLFHNTSITVNVFHNNVIYPSPTEIKKILYDNHDIPIAGHLGSSRMYNRIKDSYYWKGMRSDIESYVKQCKSCQENKALRKINRSPMQITSTSSVPCQRIAMDIVGPLPEAGSAKLKYILTIQDDLTKFSTGYPLRTITAEETSECLIHFISIFGIPKTILTDQGTNFTSELFKKTCEFLKIKQLWSSPYHPQTQGALKRSHSTLKEYLKSYVNEDQTNWPRYVYTAMLAYNSAVHSTTHYAPYELMFGHKAFIPNSIFDEDTTVTYPEYVKMLQNRLKHSRNKAVEYIHQSKINSKNYYDAHSRAIHYRTGDYVYLKNHPRSRKALTPIWKGPYKVVKVHGNNTLSLLINRRHVRHHYDEIKLAEIPRNL